MKVLAYYDDSEPTAEEVKTSLQDDVALAFKTCNEQQKRIAELEAQLAEAKSGWDSCLRALQRSGIFARARRGKP
jgi:hypothetical protein